MSPPEAHLDTELHDNQTMDAVNREMSDLEIGQKSPVRDNELETYNTFNFWRMPVPQIGDECDGNAVRKQAANDRNDSSGTSTTDSPPLQDTSQPGNATGTSKGTATEDAKSTSDEPSSTTEGNTTAEQSSNENKTPRLEFQDLGISDMDIDDECEENEKNEKDLTCEETADDDSPKRMPPLSGIPTLRFDEDYLQPYSPNMTFDDENNRPSSPPRSPRQDQVRRALT